MQAKLCLAVLHVQRLLRVQRLHSPLELKPKWYPLRSPCMSQRLM